jgi:hypothetical protein
MAEKTKITVIIKYVTVVVLLLSLAAPLAACNAGRAVEKSMVAVWVNDAASGTQDQPLAYGLVVGDGTQILTVINYQADIPDTLYVGVPGKTRYPVSIQAVDPRKSMTLLKMEKKVFPPAAIPVSTGYVAGTEVIVHGWPAGDYAAIETRRAVFLYSYTGNLLDEWAYIDAPGAVVTGQNGDVVGLLGTSYAFPFHIMLGPAGALYGGIVEIQDAMKVMSPDYDIQKLAGKPVYALLWDNDSINGRKSDLLPAGKYNDLAAALQPLLNTMAAPLDHNIEPIPVYYRELGNPSPGRLDGPIMTAVFAHPVELKNRNGDVLAKAKWLGIEWERGGTKTKLLFYGHFNFNEAVVDGGFSFDGDITELLGVLYP